MLRIIIAALTALFSCLQATEQKPNIIIFLVDDMGPMDTSVPFMVDTAGKPQKYPLNDWYKTPNMQRLADQGIRFSDFYAHTVCSPSRISIMTGQNAARHHTTNWIDPEKNNGGKQGPPDWAWEGLNKESVTLPGLLQSIGYRTIHIGKGHFAAEDKEGADPLNLGFDVNIGGFAWGAPGSYYGMKNFEKKSTGRRVPHMEPYHGKDIFLTEALTLEAIKQVDRSIEDNAPFYLYMSHYAVHLPFNPDPRFTANYDAKTHGKVAQAFASLVEGMDQSLGDLMNHLEQRGIAENTLIFFLGDNGSASPIGKKKGKTQRVGVGPCAPLRGMKGSKWEGGSRVPFIAAWGAPETTNPWQERLPIQTGAMQTQIGTCFDLFPTIINLLGAAPPEGHVVDGKDLSVLLTGAPDPSRPNSFLSHFPHSRSDNYFSSLRLGDWKLIYHYFPGAHGQEARYELYDLKSDISESKNLAKQNPERVQSMMQALVKELDDSYSLYPTTPKGDATRPILP